MAGSMFALPDPAKYQFRGPLPAHEILNTHPGGKVKVLVLHRLDVESDGGDRCDNFSYLQIISPGVFLLPSHSPSIPSICIVTSSCQHYPVRRQLPSIVVRQCMRALIGSYQSEDQNPNVFLRPDQAGELGHEAAHGRSLAVEEGVRYERSMDSCVETVWEDAGVLVSWADF